MSEDGGDDTDRVFTVVANESPTHPDARETILRDPGFGDHFTDHMVQVDWTPQSGWHHPRVVPLGPLSLHPAAAVLHYGQEIFEGLKAFHGGDDRLRVFRMADHAARFAASADRMAMPALPSDLFSESVRRLVDVDRAWLPDGRGTSLYLRPFMVATEPFLGVRPARAATFGVIASPAASYFADESAVSIWLSGRYSRAAARGTGAAKCGGNYAGALAAQVEAHRHDCAQVLFTDAATQTWVEEAGSMNLFFAFADGTVVTPPADGTILAGVTRDSVIELASSRGYHVAQRRIGIAEWASAARTGHLREVFATGTAAVVTPINRLLGDGLVIDTPTQGFGILARMLRDELTGIQRGTRPDRFGWMTDLGESSRTSQSSPSRPQRYAATV
ncbi:branched-chain amino acid aminotransferase [Mycobacterium sp. smrl_JER01]|uniref:branched-chain amino acid aminotransferase n=1 Tax=Mycobacterium sp. smrl_JER01 TaxID=3402633 RepID=UPI003ACF9AE3